MQNPCKYCRVSGGEKIPPSGKQVNPQIMFIASAPEGPHDKKAVTFSGRRGDLLRKLLSKLDVNIEEILCAYSKPCTFRSSPMCPMALMEDIRKANPKIISVLGDATEAFGIEGSISKVHGSYHERGEWRIIPVIDPIKIYDDPDSFIDLVYDLEFVIKTSKMKGSPMTRLEKENYIYIDTEERFHKLMKHLMKIKPSIMAVDIETDGLDYKNGNILSMGLSWERGKAVTFNYLGIVSNNEKNKKMLAKVLAAIPCGFHNGQFDVLWLRERGIFPNYAADSMLNSYSLDERQGSHGLKQLTSRYYHIQDYDTEAINFVRNRRFFIPDPENGAPFSIWDWEDIEVRKAIGIYNSADADFTLRLIEDLHKEMVEDDVDHLPEKILIPAADHFINTKMDGILVDVPYHDSLGVKWKVEMVSLEWEMRQFPGAERLNPGSPKQVAHYLYDVLKLKQMHGIDGGFIGQDTLLEEISEIEDPEAQDFWKSASSHQFSKMTPKSTSSYMLYFLAQQHPLPRLLVRHRLAAKKYGTYYEGYKALMGPDNRIRSDFKIHGTRTGRISSTSPNLHGMPRRNEMKRIFIADPGYTIISADYSQAEVRVAAHLSGDKALIKALGEGDIHEVICLGLFGLSKEGYYALDPEEQKLKRRAAKTITFGLLYGRSAMSLAPQIGVPVEEAEFYIEKYFRMMPEMKKFIARQKMIVAKECEVVSMYGRKRRFPAANLSRKVMAKVQRQSVNAPIQSAASDITLLTYIKVVKILQDEGIPVKRGPSLHDGYWLQVPTESVDYTVDIMKECMHDVGFKTDVPFVVDIDKGFSWGDLHKVYSG